MTLFKDQSLLIIVLETNYDISTATTYKVLYKKPDGVTGEWAAALGAADTQLRYYVQEGDIDQRGKWELQAYVVLGGLKGYGDIVIKNFRPNLD